ncbi:MAG: hypothetical protein IJ281_00800 [Clostridia bacterium]|nr:hypothetical protein [Clostridia bacterium]
MTDKILSRLQQKYPLTAIDAGEFAQLKANGMTFTVQAFHAEGLGHVSVMRAKGFFGLMRMDTLIINPVEIDLPLYSYDRIFAMGNDTLIVELYDTLVGAYDADALARVKNGYADLPERDPGTHWYDSIKLPESISKKGKKSHTPRLDQLTKEHFAAYLSSDAAPVSDQETKRQKASVYVEGLLKNGGPSTDVFKKALGEEKTEALFREILFGTK